MAEYSVQQEFAPGKDRLVNHSSRCAVLIKRRGAEVIGYDVYDTLRNRTLPILWNNNREDVPFDGAWANHATVLFPIVGMLKNQRSRLGNRVITTPCCHGFARESPFELAGVSTTDRAEIVYRLISDPATRRYYPFDFVFEMTYALRHTGLSVTFNVANADRCPIYLSFGWHPGFNTELGLGGKRHDWRIVLPKGTYRKYHVVNGEFSLLTGTTSDVVFDGPIPWTDDGLEQTLIFEIEDARNRKCRLHNSVLDLGVDLTFEDFPFLGIWGKRDQDYICIEPWQGMDDHEAQESFDQKIGIYRLAPGETVRKSCTVTPLLT